MSDERIELTEMQVILAGLSSPTDEQFVQAVRAYSDTAIASAAAKLVVEGGGGGGSLPDWWTVDSTPGSEKLSYHFDGDAFPRWTLASGVDGLHGGDGTFDPYAEGALRFFVDGDGGDTGGVRWRFYANGARLELGTFSGERGPTIDSPGAFTLGQQKLALRAGSSDPNSVLFGGPFGGNVGDIYFNVDGGALTTIWRCTVAGDPGDATWVGIL